MEYSLIIMFVCALLQAFISTVVSVALALPVAYFFYRYTFFGKHFFLALALVMSIMPTQLVALAELQFYGFTGFTGIIMAHLLLNMPFALYVLYSACHRFNQAWCLIACEYGASEWDAYTTLHLPFLRPTIISLFCIIFVLCFTSSSLPHILGLQPYHLTPDCVIADCHNTGQHGVGVLLYAVRVVIVAFFCINERPHASLGWVGLNMNRFEQRYLRGRHGILWPIFLCAVGIGILGPLVVLLVRMMSEQTFSFWAALIAGRHDAVLGVPAHYPVINSLLLACVSSVGAVIVGFIVSVLQVHASQRVQRFLGVAHSFVFVIGAVGIGILFAFIARWSSLPAFIVAVLCHCALNIPFTYRLLRAHLTSWHREFDFTACAYGAGVVERFVVLKLAWLMPAVVQAWCMAFGLSLTEVGAGSVFGGVTGMTLPMAIKVYRAHGVHEGVYGCSLLLLVCIAAFGYVSVRLVRRLRF